MENINIEAVLFSIASVMAVLMGIAVIFIRKRASKEPLTMKKVVIPPIAMSTGALMYVFPYFRLTSFEIFEAVAVGLVFSSVLILTTKYEKRDNELYVKQSKWFPVILVALLVIRLVYKSILSISISPGEIGGMFFLLAFVMIAMWRASMFYHLNVFKKQQANES
ncbi:CcdC family protein [Corticicoccus populi]|uniref:CcdC family protein n=1 Tax=Corticicoccus populi TaxID=1812821 RepID=A0ABW5WQI0_9STAP